MFKTRCPSCNANETLTVISGVFTAIGMTLFEDGFAFGEAKQVDTEDELVKCQRCCAAIKLTDLIIDEAAAEGK